MKKHFILPIALVLINGLIYSCSNDPFMEKEDQPKIDQSSEPNNDPKVLKLGQIIAKSLKNSNVGNFIQSEAIKKFDGDNNFILALAYNQKIDNESKVKSQKKTFIETLSMYIKSENDKTKTSNFETPSLFKELEQDYPLMQIAIPEIFTESEEGIDFARKPPHVVILPIDFDEKTTTTLTAIDNEGNSYQIDANEPPEEPVIVISENERLVAIVKNELDNINHHMGIPDFETEDHYYYQRGMVIQEFNGRGLNSGSSSSSSSSSSRSRRYDRDQNDNLDNLLKAKFISKSALRSVEKWTQGKPEVKLIVVFAKDDDNQLGTLTKYLGKKGWYHRKWLKLKIDTKTLNIPMLQWNKNEFGDRMKYVFIEEDANRGSKNIDIVLTSKIDNQNTINTKITLEVNKNDDEMGEALLQYTNTTAGEGTKHSTGIFEFWVNQK
ncbi:hypothetical protein [Marinifilum caeruleilacunae]|uniref:Lipoprotein n=1 Tax=Marinifilum caeruleilacunae TaxID=2499076 RepID=A0ABX1WZW2_9BACT|nr:hypothetical protein [Marinifilum caeruleilacunae]NOU61599.1 hypothetical protein [Marinifilum caeruleilacunae]